MQSKNPHACDLARNLLKDLFGETVATVCDTLLRKGTLTFSELGHITKLPLGVLRDSTLVLVQHNCVTCQRVQDEGGGGKASSGHFVYEAQLDKILQNLRKPWFLMHIRDELGEMAEFVVEALLENGRLRLDQIILSVAGKVNEKKDAIQHDVTRAVVSLINSRYLERAPPCALPVPLRKPHPNARKKKSAKAQKEEAAHDAAIQSAYGVYERERFKLPSALLHASMDGLLASLGEEPAQEGEVKQEPEVSLEPEKASTSKKRKRAQENAKKEAEKQAEEDGIADDKILWRVNFEEFNRAFRHQACVDIVSAKWNNAVGFALKCMLEVTRGSEIKVNEETSRPVSEAEIAKASEQLSERFSDTPDDLEEALGMLKDDELHFVTHLGEQAGGSLFAVNMGRIIECSQLVQLETAIRERFGNSGLRVFRLLLLKKQLEQKQVADLTMLDAKDTRSLLYQMLKAGFLQMQDIPRTADHAASRTYYTWRVTLEEARAQFLNCLYRAAHNVHARLIEELKKGKELMELAEMTESNNTTLNITESQQRRLGKLSKIIQVLQAQLLKLDEVIALMSDFTH